MTQEFALEMAIKYTTLDLISQGITTSEGIVNALKKDEVIKTIRMYADILIKEFK
jgi:hypothetical protein